MITLRLFAVVLILSLSACAHSSAKPSAAPPPASPVAPAVASDAAAAEPASTAMPNPSSADVERLREAEALRNHGLEQLYAKDPRVKDSKAAFDSLLKAAEMGDPVAMDSVGGFYSSGLGGVPKDCPKAMEWFDRAASSGYGLAANNLAYMYVTCPDKSRRDAEKAEAIMKMMFASNPSFLAVLDTYAAVLAEQGDFKQASSTMSVVVDLEQLIDTNPERVDESKHTLGLYQKHKKVAESAEAEPEVYHSSK